MAEQTRNEYVQLFEIRLLHHYWLDEGAGVFDAIPAEKKDRRLASYDMRAFLSITPTASTVSVLKGMGCIYRDTSMGCLVGVSRNRVIPDDTLFEFAVRVHDPSFFNYTALTLRPQHIYELHYQPEQKVYRYKENVPLLSNTTGVPRGENLFLSKEIPNAADGLAESFYISSGALMQLNGDQPATGTKLDNDVTHAAVYVHQGDVPAIVPPAGLAGAPGRGIELTKDIPDDVFVFISLETMRADGGDFSLVDTSGLPKETGRVFQVRFKNRATFWRYLSKKTGSVVSAETAPLSLTNFGNAGTKQKPSAGLVKAVKSGDKITQLVSEIFV